MIKCSLTWTGVGVYDCYAFLGCAVLEEAFLCAIVSRASEPGKVENHGDFMWSVARCLWWKVEVQGHLAPRGRGIVSQLQELAAKGRYSCSGFERHLDIAG